MREVPCCWAKWRIARGEGESVTSPIGEPDAKPTGSCNQTEGTRGFPGAFRSACSAECSRERNFESVHGRHSDPTAAGALCGRRWWSSPLPCNSCRMWGRWRRDRRRGVRGVGVASRRRRFVWWRGLRFRRSRLHQHEGGSSGGLRGVRRLSICCFVCRSAGPCRGSGQRRLYGTTRWCRRQVGLLGDV